MMNNSQDSAETSENSLSESSDTDSEDLCGVCNNPLPETHKSRHIKACLFKHGLLPQSQIHVCPECHKEFPYKYKLTVHLRTHEDTLRWECTHCETPWAEKRDAEQCYNIHWGIKDHQCHYCDEMFPGYKMRWYHEQKCQQRPSQRDAANLSDDEEDDDLDANNNEDMESDFNDDDDGEQNNQNAEDVSDEDETDDSEEDSDEGEHVQNQSQLSEDYDEDVIIRNAANLSDDEEDDDLGDNNNEDIQSDFNDDDDEEQNNQNAEEVSDEDETDDSEEDSDEGNHGQDQSQLSADYDEDIIDRHAESVVDDDSKDDLDGNNNEDVDSVLYDDDDEEANIRNEQLLSADEEDDDFDGGNDEYSASNASQRDAENNQLTDDDNEGDNIRNAEAVVDNEDDDDDLDGNNNEDIESDEDRVEADYQLNDNDGDDDNIRNAQDGLVQEEHVCDESNNEHVSQLKSLKRELKNLVKGTNANVTLSSEILLPLFYKLGKCVVSVSTNSGLECRITTYMVQIAKRYIEDATIMDALCSFVQYSLEHSKFDSNIEVFHLAPFGTLLYQIIVSETLPTTLKGKACGIEICAVLGYASLIKFIDDERIHKICKIIAQSNDLLFQSQLFKYICLIWKNIKLSSEPIVTQTNNNLFMLFYGQVIDGLKYGLNETQIDSFDRFENEIQNELSTVPCDASAFNNCCLQMALRFQSAKTLRSESNANELTGVLQEIEEQLEVIDQALLSPSPQVPVLPGAVSWEMRSIRMLYWSKALDNTLCRLEDSSMGSVDVMCDGIVFNGGSGLQIAFTPCRQPEKFYQRCLENQRAGIIVNDATLEFVYKVYTDSSWTHVVRGRNIALDEYRKMQRRRADQMAALERNRNLVNIEASQLSEPSATNPTVARVSGRKRKRKPRQRPKLAMKRVRRI